MRKTLLLLTCVALVIGMAMPAQALEIGVRGYYWLPDVSGNVKADVTGIPGNNLDLKSDLGFDDENYAAVEAFAGLGSHHLSLSYYRVDYSGTNTLTKDINFGGKTFDANFQLNSSLEYDVYDLMYQYDLLDLENIMAGFSLGFVAKVKYFDGNVGIESTTASASVDFSVPIPMVGLSLHVGILADLLELRVLATGISYGDGTVLDGMADISFTPFPLIDIHGGYRVFEIDVDADDVEFNYDTSGPYVAVTVSF